MQLAEGLARTGRKLNASFHVADIVNLDLGRKFPLAIMTSWTWQVLVTQGDQIAFLRRLHDHLEPGGAFAFNVFIPFHRQRGLTEEKGVYEWPSKPGHHSGARRTYDPASQVETLVEPQFGAAGYFRTSGWQASPATLEEAGGKLGLVVARPWAA